MTERPEPPAPSATAVAAQRALELKRAAAGAPLPGKRSFADERVARRPLRRQEPAGAAEVAAATPERTARHLG
jgi:hypothetical protein